MRTTADVTAALRVSPTVRTVAHGAPPGDPPDPMRALEPTSRSLGASAPCALAVRDEERGA